MRETRGTGRRCAVPAATTARRVGLPSLGENCRRHNGGRYHASRKSSRSLGGTYHDANTSDYADCVHPPSSMANPTSSCSTHSFLSFGPQQLYLIRFRPSRQPFRNQVAYRNHSQSSHHSDTLIVFCNCSKGSDHILLIFLIILRLFPIICDHQ